MPSGEGVARPQSHRERTVADDAFRISGGVARSSEVEELDREVLSPGQLHETPERIEAASVLARERRGVARENRVRRPAVEAARGGDVAVVAQVRAHEDERTRRAEELPDEVGRGLGGQLRDRDGKEREPFAEDALEERQLYLQRVLGGVPVSYTHLTLPT